jgi:diguanylate cyclase (GGDEF)-like protein
MCLRNLLRLPGERVHFKDLDGRLLLLSEGYLDNVAPGHATREVLGRSDFDFYSTDHAGAARQDELAIISTGDPVVAKLQHEAFPDRPGSWVRTTKAALRDATGAIVGTFGVSRDVTAQVLAERSPADQALRDPLTGLASRLALMDRLSQAVLSLDRQTGAVGLLLVDLDGFKAINESLGHRAGDSVLVEVGRRLRRVIRRGDTVARLGDDDFALLYPQLRDGEVARWVAARVLRVVGEKFVDNGADLSVTASIGVACTSEPAGDHGELLRQAEAAMHEAKRAGRNRFRVFDPQLRPAATPGSKLEAELRHAIAAGELFLVYQPVFSLEPLVFRGVEALVRWAHPERGTIGPAEFIPVAEDHGFVAAIDAFVLAEACGQLARWAAEGRVPEDFVMAVNVSARELSDPALVERVAGTLRRHAVDPSKVCLEVTETALTGDLGDVEGAFGGLSDLGLRLALDDFGTGYSTLTHLQRLRADVLKIDRSFVDQLGRSARAHEIIAAMTVMAHALGMSVVGEGIETPEQLHELADLGCDEGQGFLLARPLPPDEVPSRAQGGPGRAHGAKGATGKSRRSDGHDF